MPFKSSKKIIILFVILSLGIFGGIYFVYNGKSAFDLFSGVYHKLGFVFSHQQACADSAGSGCGAGAGGDGGVYDAGELTCSYLLTWQPDKYDYKKGGNITFDYNIENLTYTQDVYCDALTGSCTYGPLYPLPDCNLIGNWARPYMDPANATAADKYSGWTTNYVSYCGDVRCNSYESSGGTMTRLLPDSYSDGSLTAGKQNAHLHWKPAAWYNQTQGELYDLRVTDTKEISIDFPPTASNLLANTDNFCSNNTVNFSWNFSDPDGGNQTRYAIAIDDEPNFFTPLIVSAAEYTSNNFYIWNEGQRNKTYYWKLGVRDDENNFSGYNYPSPSSFDTQDCNRPPIANAGPDQTVDEGTAVTLNGSLSSDPDGDQLAFNWTGQIALSGANTANPTFTAPQVDDNTTYTFALTVNDGRGATSSDSVDIRVTNIGPPPPPIGDNKPPSVASTSIDTFDNTYDLCELDKPKVFFNWVFSDPDTGDSQSAWRVQIDNDPGFGSLGKIDSLKVTNTSNSFPGSLPEFGVDYFWRVMVWDSKDAPSKWYPLDPKDATFKTPEHDYPTVAFEPHKAVTNQPVQFEDKSTVSESLISSRYWTFQDASPASSTIQNPSVTFLSPGEKEKAKSVFLQVTDSSGLSCQIQGAVDVGLPLPGWIEVPPY